MQATKQDLAALNARVSKPVHRRFEIAVAHRGIAKQKAVEEALQLWIAHQSSLRQRKMGKAPLIRSGKPGSLNLTGQDIDEVLFG
jgi:hypothetical protein